MKQHNKDFNSIEALESDYLFIKPSQIPNSGNGLYTAIDIYKDETIAIFKGEILSIAESNKRAITGDNKYFIKLLNGKILDSMHTDCFAKYANDANGFLPSNFKNNAKIIVNDNNEVCLMAKKRIKINEEIFCSYGKKYWTKNHFNI